jgi:WhiB family redox-sensing transcriptional regulator
MAIQAWRDNARCVGVPSDVFFPDALKETRFDAALKLCSECSVTDQCLNLVIGLDDVDDKWGVFGGLTPRQRRVVRYEMERGHSLAHSVKVVKNVGRPKKR